MPQDWSIRFQEILAVIDKIGLHLEAQKKELENREERLQDRGTSQDGVLCHLIKVEEEMRNLSFSANKLIYHMKEEEELAKTTMKHIDSEEVVEFKSEMDAVLEDLNEKFEEFNQLFTEKECKINKEVQDIRKLLIRSFGSGQISSIIGLKRMGELDDKSFLAAMKRNFPPEEAQEKAAVLCSKWRNILRDATWHPFKIILDEEGVPKEMADEEDEKLRSLKNDYGEEVFNAVKTALIELNEYNPNGWYPIQQLWNLRENRRATLYEGVAHILKP